MPNPTIISAFTQFLPNKPLAIFAAGDKDQIVTVEFKNTNPYDAVIDVSIVNSNGVPVLETPIHVKIKENRSYKKHNLLCKAGDRLVVSTTYSGLAIRANIPHFYLNPGQISLMPGETETVDVFFDVPDGKSHTVEVNCMIDGITVDKTTDTITAGTPTSFKFSRDTMGIAGGQVLFQIRELGVATVLDIGYGTIKDDLDTNGDGVIDDVLANLVQKYSESRDTVAGYHFDPTTA